MQKEEDIQNNEWYKNHLLKLKNASKKSAAATNKAVADTTPKVKIQPGVNNNPTTPIKRETVTVKSEIKKEPSTERDSATPKCTTAQFIKKEYQNGANTTTQPMRPQKRKIDQVCNKGMASPPLAPKKLQKPSPEQPRVRKDFPTKPPAQPLSIRARPLKPSPPVNKQMNQPLARELRGSFSPRQKLRPTDSVEKILSEDAESAAYLEHIAKLKACKLEAKAKKDAAASVLEPSKKQLTSNTCTALHSTSIPLSHDLASKPAVKHEQKPSQKSPPNSKATTTTTALSSPNLKPTAVIKRVDTAGPGLIPPKKVSPKLEPSVVSAPSPDLKRTESDGITPGSTAAPASSKYSETKQSIPATNAKNASHPATNAKDVSHIPSSDLKRTEGDGITPGSAAAPASSKYSETKQSIPATNAKNASHPATNAKDVSHIPSSDLKRTEGDGITPGGAAAPASSKYSEMKQNIPATNAKDASPIPSSDLKRTEGDGITPGSAAAPASSKYSETKQSIPATNAKNASHPATNAKDASPVMPHVTQPVVDDAQDFQNSKVEHLHRKPDDEPEAHACDTTTKKEEKQPVQGGEAAQKISVSMIGDMSQHARIRQSQGHRWLTSINPAPQPSSDPHEKGPTMEEPAIQDQASTQADDFMDGFITLDSIYEPLEDDTVKNTTAAPSRHKASDFFQTKEPENDRETVKIKGILKNESRPAKRRLSPEDHAASYNKYGSSIPKVVTTRHAPQEPVGTSRHSRTTKKPDMRVKPEIPCSERNSLEVCSAKHSSSRDDVIAQMNLDTAIAAGLEHIHPVSGYQCVLCRTFYLDYPTALHHCTMLSHKMKVMKDISDRESDLDRKVERVLAEAQDVVRRRPYLS